MVWLDIDALVGTFLDVLLPRVGLDYIADYKTAYTILEIQTLEYIFIHYILAIKNVITMVPVQAQQSNSYRNWEGAPTADWFTVNLGETELPMANDAQN